ncbi:hypothetical protein [Bacillus sp. FJAT-27916]|uniref:hypothetical protein n=1 Tax=Bacillus sp. FJAT-27916 TaxID=1679169 RepID=UPI000A46A3B6|nr:hypothetical protein [Bacillus sp. FJAT-27916]
MNVSPCILKAAHSLSTHPFPQDWAKTPVGEGSRSETVLPQARRLKQLPPRKAQPNLAGMR